MVQCLGLCAFIAEGPGLIPGGVTKTYDSTSPAALKKKKEIETGNRVESPGGLGPGSLDIVEDSKTSFGNHPQVRGGS